MQAPDILIISLVILCQFICDTRSQYCKRPVPSRHKDVSDQISECEAAVASLDSADEGSCAAPDSVVARKSQLIKSAMQREIQRLKKVDPKVPLMDQIHEVQMETHRALLAAYDTLRRRRELMANVKPRKSKFAERFDRAQEYQYYEDDDYYFTEDGEDGGNVKNDWPMMKDL